ncbi:MAG: succinate dehydrogenase, hydrophobic membrane anchor protein [Alphaproteobacteria bacterium]|nr:succinate dehydrogenase, hydrophobic membrane anchor protein [Alphaproteobacteria bacterium]
MSQRAPLAHARGLGSAKEGAHHWWHQRLSAVALVFLSIWFVVSLISLTGAGYDQVYLWMAHPVVAGLLLLLVVFTFYHLKLGLQVVIEDYIHTEWLKVTSLVVMSGACLVLGLACALSVVSIAFGG